MLGCVLEIYPIRCILFLGFITGDAMSSEKSQFTTNLEDIEHFSTENYTARKPQLVVLHYTAGSDNSSLEWLAKSRDSGVSAHYLIKGDGGIVQIVRDGMRAWHGGRGVWRGLSDINSLSLGVEIVNWGYDDVHVPEEVDRSSCVMLSGSPLKWFPFPEEQFRSIAELLVDFKERWDIQPSLFIGHSDIAPGRKVDPGPLFPWERLYKEFGIGAWVEDLERDLCFVTLPQAGKEILWTQLRLRDYGYGCPLTGELDEGTQAVVQAFQMHFRPSLIDGKPDVETRLILAHLVDLYCYN